MCDDDLCILTRVKEKTKRSPKNCPKIEKVRLGVHALTLEPEDTLESKKYHIELDEGQLFNLYKVIHNYIKENDL